jgi:5-methylcytosine-specific restriction endonuclease McrA
MSEPTEASNTVLTASQLFAFLKSKMRMSHIYQPLLIRTVLQRNGRANIRDIAREFLAHDESQIEYYERIAKVMPIPVLRRHGIVSRCGDEIEIQTELTREEQQEIIEICDQKIESYKQQRGVAIWQHRTFRLGDIPGNTRYEVLKRAKFRCDLCGIPASERALEVDHIKPRKHGGTDDLENLQALCWKCNGGKGASDSTDFRSVRAEAEKALLPTK